MPNDELSQCWLYGDEGGDIHKDRFFAIGLVGTRRPQEVDVILKSIRRRTNFYGEISYKSSDDRRALCALRWIDWFFSNQEICNFKILVKDQASSFNRNYFANNHYKTGASQLAYCQTYKEVLCNFADYNGDKKIFTYSQISLEKMNVADYLVGKVPGLFKENCFSGSTKSQKPTTEEFTLNAELLQLTDLLTSSIRGLYSALNNDGVNKSWVKRTLQLNFLYHYPDLKCKILDKKNVYYPSYSPYSRQKFAVFYWKPNNMPKHL